MTAKTPEQINGAINRKSTVTVGLVVSLMIGGVPLIWFASAWCARVEARLAAIERSLSMQADNGVQR